jgi:hypothetical protein
MNNATKPVNQSESVRQLTAQAKNFADKMEEYRRLHYEYDKLSDSLKSSFTRKKQNKEKPRIALEKLQKIHLDILNHPFRQLLHQQPAYQQAWLSFKKKIFGFQEKISSMGINDEIALDDYIASTFSSYQFFSDKKEHLVLLKKSRLKKIEKLAKTLQIELNKSLLFDNAKLQQEIYSALDHLIGIKKPPALMPYRRHTKMAREMLIKGLALAIYNLHYSRMAHYKRRASYNLEPDKNKKITSSTAFIDNDISERRVASIVARIKPQMQSEHPELFSQSDAKHQKIEDLLS